MAFPVFRHQDAAEVGMTDEADAEEVENLAFEEIRRGPDAGDGFHRLVFREPDFEAHAGFAWDREQMVDDLEARRLRMPVDTGDVAEEVVAEGGVVTEQGNGLADEGAVDPDGQLVAVELGVRDRLGVGGEEARELGALFSASTPAMAGVSGI